MKSFKVLLLLIAISLTTVSCGFIQNELGLSSKKGVQFNDLSYSEKDLDADLKAIANNEELVESLKEADQPLVKDGKVTETYRASWANIQLQILAIKEARIANDKKIEKKDREDAQEQAKSLFVQSDAENAKEVWDGFDKSFRDRLIEGYAEQSALLRAAPKVTDKEAKTYFEENKATFTQCASGRAVSHILVADEEKADSIKKQLNEGADFAKLAKKNSTDPGSKANGGSLGCYVEGQFVTEFDNVAKSLAFGTISDPVKTEFGFHIIKADAFTAPTFEDVKDQIVTTLEPTKQEELFADVEKRLKKGKVKVLKKYGKVIRQDGIPSIVPLGTEDPSKTTTTAPSDGASIDEATTSVPTS